MLNLKTVSSDSLRRYHLLYNLEALESVKNYIAPATYERLKEMVMYRLTGKGFKLSPVEERVSLALSGGVDSTASLKLMRWAGFKVVPITALLPQLDEETVKKVGAAGAVLVGIPGYMDEIERLMRDRAPICGRCHSMIMQAVEEEAIKEGTRVLVTGDMISFGPISIYRKGALVVLNLPAFLAMDKTELIGIAGEKYRPTFGCPILWEAFRRAPGIKKFAIERILRELRARAITPELAGSLIRDVLSR